MNEARHWRRELSLGTKRGVPIERGSGWRLARRAAPILDQIAPFPLDSQTKAGWRAVDQALNRAMASGLHEDWQTYSQVLGREW